jgi:hypothetical protein
MFFEKTFYNNRFRFVFQPNPSLGYDSRRFGVSANRLYSYITSANANTAFDKAWSMRSDKLRLKFRKYGILDIYVK